MKQKSERLADKGKSMSRLLMKQEQEQVADEARAGC